MIPSATSGCAPASTPAVLERLADADAFRSIGLDRREALWAVRGLNRAGDKDDLPLFRAVAADVREPDADLPPMPLGEHVVEDYRHLSLSLKAHPVAFVRSALAARGISKSEDLAGIDAPAQNARLPRVTVAGLVLVRQRPGTGKGVIFMTLEDETGIANIIVWPKIFEVLRPIVIGARFVAVTGRLQNEAGVIHVIAERIADLTPWLGLLAMRGPEPIAGLARADAVTRPPAARGKRCPGEDAPTFAFADEPPAAAAGQAAPQPAERAEFSLTWAMLSPTETVMTDTPDNDISFDRSRRRRPAN